MRARRVVVTAAAQCALRVSVRTQTSSSSTSSTTTTTTTPDAMPLPVLQNSDEPQRVLYPRVRMRAYDELPSPPTTRSAHAGEAAGTPRRVTTADDASRDGHVTTTTWPLEDSSNNSSSTDAATTTTMHDKASSDDVRATMMTTTSAVPTDAATSAATDTPEHDAAAVQAFFAAVEAQHERATHARNAATIPLPDDPDLLVPLFRRVRRHATLQHVQPDSDYPTFARRDVVVALPPSPPHPWLKHTPRGPHIVHGDGQQQPIVGTGEVGFEDDGGACAYDADVAAQRRRFAGLRYHSVLHRTLPSCNGVVAQSLMRVQHSFRATGRGVFATRAIAQGQLLMVVQSTAHNVGVKGEVRRLEEMCVTVLRNVYEAMQQQQQQQRQEQQEHKMNSNNDNNDSNDSNNNNDDDGQTRCAQLRFLHEWVLTAQPSSLLECWPAASTQRVMDAIGGDDVLAALELLPPHIARLAAIMDLCSFLAESCFAERKGATYFAEAAFFNHSCAPNVTYDIMPEHMFVESTYYDALRSDGHTSLQPQPQPQQQQQQPCARRPATRLQARDDDDDDDDDSLAATTTTTTTMTTTTTTTTTTQPTHEVSLTESSSSPSYLFCCRAARDIAAGEELLISYVPPSWRFDDRQFVLLDRYRFRCRCDACAPAMTQLRTRAPRAIAGLVVFVVSLQLLLSYRRAQLDARVFTGVVDGDDNGGDDDDDDDADAATRDSDAMLRRARQLGAQEVQENVHASMRQYVA